MALRAKSMQLAVIAGLVTAATPTAFGQSPLETETARLPKQGHGNFNIGAEYQTSRNGNEFAAPLDFGYGLTDRLELSIEPVSYARIKPKGARPASGFGDTEVTLKYLWLDETEWRPAFAIAGEVKIPTTKNPLLGTGATDYRVFGILSKRIGNFDLHANVGYTFVGQPSGLKLNDIFDLSLAAEYEVGPHLSLVTEILANTSAGGSEAATSFSQEVASSNVTGLLGAIFRPAPYLEYSFGVTYDSDNATLLRLGAGLKF